MLLDQIWKQQLTLVTYGNAYLTHNLNFNQWVEHSIFDQHQLEFRQLSDQKLLAQHFQIWLEGLKRQGVQKLSLHRAELLVDENNPNPNVELLPYAHFIVSHSPQQKLAWICGQEIPAWDQTEKGYTPPYNQKNPLRHDTFWCYELNKKLAKSLQNDLQNADWEKIYQYLNQELFQQPFSQGFIDPEEIDIVYTGLKSHEAQETHSLLPRDHSAFFVHRMLYRFDAFKAFLEQKIQHPYIEDGTILTPAEQQALGDFAQKTEEFHSKFIVKAANHYHSAQINVSLDEKLDVDVLAQSMPDTHSASLATNAKPQQFGVFKLVLVVIVMCAIAYYFGL